MVFKCAEKELFTLPFVLDMISDVEVEGDVGTDSGRPVLPDVGLGHLHDREGQYGLSHSSPSSKHHSSILRLPGDRALNVSNSSQMSMFTLF